MGASRKCCSGEHEYHQGCSSCPSLETDLSLRLICIATQNLQTFCLCNTFSLLHHLDKPRNIPYLLYCALVVHRMQCDSLGMVQCYAAL